MMGSYPPVVPADLVPLLPRPAQCLAMVAREQAARAGRRDGDSPEGKHNR